MRSNQVAVVGAAETTELGVIPNMSQIQLHADAALNAIADAGLKLSDIDGIATAVETPQQICHYLGITPTWVDGTSVGGCSFMLHVRHAARGDRGRPLQDRADHPCRKRQVDDRQAAALDAAGQPATASSRRRSASTGRPACSRSPCCAT